MKKVLLIGAGHAHLAVLRSLAEKPLYGARIALVTPHAKQVYSGMLPGILAGHYRRAEAEVDVAQLAERGYVEFMPGRVQRFDPGRRAVSLENGASAGYDLVSINAGALIDASLPGAEHALPVKPYDEFLSGLPIAERVAVVGAGAAGAEIARRCATAARWLRSTRKSPRSASAWRGSFAAARWTTGRACR